MSNKEIVIELVRQLPSKMSLREIAREIQLIASVREGFEEPSRAEDIPLKEVDQILAEWNQPSVDSMGVQHVPARSSGRAHH